MIHSLTNQRTGLMPGDIIRVRSFPESPISFSVTRTAVLRDDVLIPEINDGKNSIPTEFKTVESLLVFICQLTGLQAFKQEGSNEYSSNFILQSGDEIFSEVKVQNLDLLNQEFLAIKKALDEHSGRRSHAAGLLGISERTLYRKIKELGQMFDFETGEMFVKTS